MLALQIELVKLTQSGSNNSNELRRARARALLSLVGVVIACTLATGCSPAKAEKGKAAKDDAIPVSVAHVELAPLDRTLPIVGTLFAKDEATISAEVEGQVEKTMVDFGDRVQVGQQLALINTTTYDALAKQSAANLAKAKANSLNAEHELQRVQELRKSGIASESDLDKAQTESEQKNAEIKSAEADEAIARLHLEKSQVRAPFDAAVAERIASAGDFMKTGSPLFRLVNDSVLKYIVQAPERYAGHVKKEQLVVFSVDAFPEQKFEGKVYLISPSVNMSTRAFAFGALVKNADGKLKASTFARGELILDRNVPTPVVPLDAVINFAGVTKIFVVEGGIAKAHSVQAGRILQGRQEILGGLKPGDSVVVSGQTKLFDGAKVRVKDSHEAR